MFAATSGDNMLRLTVSGPPGSGTSTLVEKICLNRDWNSLNGGQIFRDEAANRGLSVVEFSALCKQDLDVDRSLDSKLKEIISSPNSPEVVESRLCGWWAHNMEIDCLRVWISVSDEERARRIQTREGGSFEERLLESRQRQEDDNQRYLELYEIDMEDMTPYNLIIEADNLDANEVFSIVSEELGG
ncbi:MAG: cytidylate kinase [Euryarchaeota archaeon]|nr:cytidylate kinase [Euryarchaeota archaeon]